MKIEGECNFEFAPTWNLILPEELVLPEGML